MSRSIRLLTITHYFATHGGGIEIVAARLTEQFSLRDIQIDWIASDVDLPRSVDAYIHYIPMSCWNVVEQKIGIPFPVWSLGAFKKVVGLVRTADLVIVHDILYLPNIWGMLCAICLKRPFVIIQHVGLVPFRSAFLRGLMSLGNRTVGRFLMHKAAAVVFISKTVRDYFASVSGGNTAHWRLIPNGVDLERFVPSCPAEEVSETYPDGKDYLYRFLFVGRFVEKKGLALLRRLAEAMPAVQWVFIGMGPLDPAQWGLKNVRVIGLLEQSALPDWYRQCDLLVLPSCGEGFPLVVQEAMACGLPVAISSETAEGLPGVRDIVFHAPVTGEVGDAEVWHRLLSNLLADDVLQRRRSGVAEFVKQNWSWERSAEQYLALFEDILKRPIREKSRQAEEI